MPPKRGPRCVLAHVPRPEYRGAAVAREFINIMPVGLLGLADALDRAGADVEVVHAGVSRGAGGLAALLARREPELVGFSLQWHHQLYNVVEEARAARRALPEARIVVGGMTASFFAEELIRRFPFLDAVVAGDAEEPLRLLAAGAPLSQIPNLVYRSGSIVRNPRSYVITKAGLDRLDFARFDLLRDAQRYDAQWFRRPDAAPSQRIYYLCAGRGCSVSCSFCGGSRAAHRALAGRLGPVVRSAARLRDDAVKAAAAGFRTLYICFDPPGLAPGHYAEFFGLIGRDAPGLSMIFEAYRLPSERFLDAFAGAFDLSGSQLALSPDSADEAARRRHKGYWYSNAALEKCLDACARRGIPTTLYFTILPTDDCAAVRRLKGFQERARRLFGCRIETIPVEVEPASRWQAQPQRWGLPAGPFDFDYFYDRHRRVATAPGDPAAAEGLDFPGMADKIALLRA